MTRYAKEFSRVLTWVVGIGLSVGFVVFYRAEIAQAFSRVSIGTCLLVVLTIVAQWFIRAFRDVRMFHGASYSIPFVRMVSINAVQLILNHLPFRAGTLYAAISLRKESGVRIADFGIILTAQHILRLAVCTTVSGFLLFVEAGPFSFAPWLFTIATLICISVLWLPIPAPRRISTLLQKLRESISCGGDSSKHGSFFMLLACTIAIFFLDSLRMFILLKVVSSDVNVTDAVVFATVGYLSVVLSVTPSGIGIRELMVGLAAPLVHQTFSAGTVASTLDRIFLLASAVVVAILMHAMLRRIGNRREVRMVGLEEALETGIGSDEREQEASASARRG